MAPMWHLPNFPWWNFSPHKPIVIDVRAFSQFTQLLPLTDTTSKNIPFRYHPFDIRKVQAVSLLQNQGIKEYFVFSMDDVDALMVSLTND
jgi:hypothetical protein